VQDLAGLGIAVVINFFGLPGAENLQRSACKLRIDKGVLQRDNQAVASERGDEPWKSSARHEHQVIRACDRQPERGHVLECLAKQTIKFLVAGLNLGHLL
jgi:hypothetical protein